MAGAKVQRYELLEQIGLGGMAEVFRARQIEDGGRETTVVIKKILPHLSSDPGYRTMFIDEAKIAATLRHPNIVQLFDVGRMDGHLFLALEFVDGADMRALLGRSIEQNLPLTIATALYAVREVLKGLDYAHKRVDPEGTPMQIVHRDVSPQNVFLSRRGEVKLGDFGIATAAMRGGRTVVGVVKGNPLYMAPEQVRGGALDPRTDVFAAGLLLLTLICGRHPAEEEPLPVLLNRALNAQVPRPSDIKRGVPEAIDLLVLRATMLDPNHRFPSAGAFARAIEDYAATARIPLEAMSLGRIVEVLFPAKAPPTEALPPMVMGTVAEKEVTGANKIVHGESLQDAAPPTAPKTAPPSPSTPARTPAGMDIWSDPLFSAPSIETLFSPSANAAPPAKPGMREMKPGGSSTTPSTQAAYQKADNAAEKPLAPPESGRPAPPWESRGKTPAPPVAAPVSAPPGMPDPRPAPATWRTPTPQPVAPPPGSWPTPTPQPAAPWEAKSDEPGTARIEAPTTPPPPVNAPPPPPAGAPPPPRASAPPPAAPSLAASLFGDEEDEQERTRTTFRPPPATEELAPAAPQTKPSAPAGTIAPPVAGARPDLAFGDDEEEDPFDARARGGNPASRGAVMPLTLEAALMAEEERDSLDKTNAQIPIAVVQAAKQLAAAPPPAAPVPPPLKPPRALESVFDDTSEDKTEAYDSSESREATPLAPEEIENTPASPVPAFTPAPPIAAPPWSSPAPIPSAAPVSTPSVRSPAPWESKSKPAAPAPAAAAAPAGPKAPVAAPIATLIGHRQTVSGVAISRDCATIVSAGHDRLVRSWSMVTGKQIRDFKGHSAAATCVAISGDGKHALSGSRDKSVILWNLETGAAVRTLTESAGWIFTVALSRDSRFAAAGSQDKMLRVWDLSAARAPTILEGHRDTVSAVALFENDTRILTGSYDRTVRVWSLETGETIQQFEGADSVRAVAVSASGRLALSGGADSRGTLWDLKSGQKIGQLAGHAEPVVALEFSPDERYAVTGSYDGTARLWDVTRQQEVRTFVGHTDPVMAVAFSLDRKKIVTGSGDGTLRVWSTGL